MFNKHYHVTYRLYVTSLNDWPLVYDSRLGQKDIDGREYREGEEKSYIAYSSSLRKWDKRGGGNELRMAGNKEMREGTQKKNKVQGSGGWGDGPGDNDVCTGQRLINPMNEWRQILDKASVIRVVSEGIPGHEEGEREGRVGICLGVGALPSRRVLRWIVYGRVISAGVFFSFSLFLFFFEAG